MSPRITRCGVRRGADFFLEAAGPLSQSRVGARVRWPSPAASTPTLGFRLVVAIDYLVMLATVLLLLGAGLLGRRRSRTAGEFVLGGRRLPWWLAGTAMVAASSNADSPLHQSGKIRRDGLAGAWFYWAQIVPQTFHALVFSRLWRRAEINTVVEFYEIRYAGRGQVAGRVWSMVFVSLFEGTLAMSLGILAMSKISAVLLGWTSPIVVLGAAIAPELAIALLGVGLAATYSTVSGLLGVVAGDLVEFVIAMVCSVVLMFFVYREVGYADGLQTRLAALGKQDALSFGPSWGLALLVFFLVQPLAMVAGANAVNHRFMAVKNEREAMFAGLWRIVNHYVFRAWPWYVCGLASLVLVAEGTAAEMAYPTLIAQYLPAGFRGLMFAGLLVAFIGSISAHMHHSGSVFVNDFYRAYLARDRSERHYVWAIRTMMLVFAAVAMWVALTADHVLGLLQLVMTVKGASGLVLLLRWFWWRVNAWADLSAQVLGLPITLLYEYGASWFGPERDPVMHVMRWCGGTSADDRFAAVFVLAVATTTAIWLTVMWLTPPEPMDKLQSFFRRVRPYGAWGRVAAGCPGAKSPDRFGADLLLCAIGVTFSFASLFAVGAAVFGSWGRACVCAGVAVGAALLLVRKINRQFAVPAAKGVMAAGVIASGGQAPQPLGR